MVRRKQDFCPVFSAPSAITPEATTLSQTAQRREARTTTSSSTSARNSETFRNIFMTGWAGPRRSTRLIVATLREKNLRSDTHLIAVGYRGCHIVRKFLSAHERHWTLWLWTYEAPRWNCCSSRRRLLILCCRWRINLQQLLTKDLRWNRAVELASSAVTRGSPGIHRTCPSCLSALRSFWRKHPSMPMCVAWITSISSFRKPSGTTNRWSLITMLLCTVSWSRRSKYGLGLSGSAFRFSGHPLRIIVRSCEMIGSLADSSLICIHRASLTGRVARWLMLARTRVKSFGLTSGKTLGLACPLTSMIRLCGNSRSTGTFEVSEAFSAISSVLRSVASWRWTPQACDPSYNLNTPACNASGSQTFHSKLCEASSVVLPLTKPHKVWGETLGYQKRYGLVCWDCMRNNDPARIPKELWLVIRLYVGFVASIDVRLEPLTCEDDG